MAITDAADAALARARAAALGAVRSRQAGRRAQTDYGTAAGLPTIRTLPARNWLTT